MRTYEPTKEDAMNPIKGKTKRHSPRSITTSLVAFAAFAVLFLSVLAVYPLSVEATDWPGFKRTPAEIVSRLQERLNLTSAQVDAIRPIIEESHQKHLELRNEIIELRESTHEKIGSVLTEEQLQEFDAMRDQRRGKMRDRMHRRPDW